MQDISIFTGGQYFAEEAGVFLDKNAEDPETLKASFGIAKNVTITKEDTIIVGGKG